MALARRRRKRAPIANEMRVRAPVRRAPNGNLHKIAAARLHRRVCPRGHRIYVSVAVRAKLTDYDGNDERHVDAARTVSTEQQDGDAQSSTSAALADNLSASRIIARRRIERNTSLPVTLGGASKQQNSIADASQQRERDGEFGANANMIPEENSDTLGVSSSSSSANAIGPPASASTSAFGESRAAATFKRRSQKAVGASTLPGVYESETEQPGRDVIGARATESTPQHSALLDGRATMSTIDSDVSSTTKPKSTKTSMDEAGRSFSLQQTLANAGTNKEDNLSDQGSFSNEIQSQCLFMSVEKTQTAFVAAQHVKNWWSQLLVGASTSGAPPTTTSSSVIATTASPFRVVEPRGAHKYAYDRVQRRGRTVRTTTCDSDSDSN